MRRTLETVDKTITGAASLGYTRWSQAGLAVASTDDLPISAFQHIGNVSDEQEFRKGILGLVRGLDRIAQHDVLLEATKRALAVSEGDSFQWFLGKGAKPGASPPAAAQAPHPPSTRPTDATPQRPPPAAPRPWTDQPLPASEAGPDRAPPTRAVRISGLRDLRAPEVSVGLSALFQTPVYLTPPDQQRGYGFAVIPAAVFENLFSDYPSRWYESDGMWGVTLDSRRQSNGEAFHADLTALTMPPPLRPGPSPEQDPKRRRIDEGHRPPTSWARAAPGLPGPPPPLAPERPPRTRRTWPCTPAQTQMGPHPCRWPRGSPGRPAAGSDYWYRSPSPLIAPQIMGSSAWPTPLLRPTPSRRHDALSPYPLPRRPNPPAPCTRPASAPSAALGPCPRPDP